jgi:DNA-binding NarL/FixJ family response regulator
MVILSPQLRKIRLLLYSGDSMKTIAFRMHISEATAKAYAHALYQRLGVINRTDMMSREIARLSHWE